MAAAARFRPRRHGRHARRCSLLVVLLLAGLLVGPLAPPAAQAANPYSTSATINVRSEPSTSARIIGRVFSGERVAVLCQDNGTSVRGSRIWDYVEYAVTGTTRTKRGWVADAYVRTGTTGAVPGVAWADCTATPSPPVKR